ncbi:MAG: GAF domain-containing protein [Aggregatilineales bacterium]
MTVIVHRLKEIVAAVMYATEAHDPEEVLQRIADSSRDLANTKYAALGIPDGRGSLRYFKVSGIDPKTAAKIDHLPVGHGLIGAIMRERHVIRLDNMQKDRRSSGFPENHPPMDSFLGVPIQLGEQLFGMLYLSDKQDGSVFNDADILLIETMANYAALAIAGAEIREKSQRLALLEERERISMALHDGIIQSLYGIGMQIDLLRHQDNLTGETLTPIVTYLNTVIEDIRGYIMDLRQHETSTQTVHACLEILVTRLHIPDSIKTTIDAPDNPMPFLPSVTEGILLIAGEALSNAVRHSNASEIQLISRQTDEFFGIRITDDGDGFDTDNLTGSSGLGLRNMQHRIQLYGGTLDIESVPGTGTTLNIRIPVQPG